MTEYYQKLSISMDQQSIDRINQYIDETGHRTSRDIVFGAHDFLRKTYGEDFFKNYPGRQMGGPGKHEACFIRIPPDIIESSNLNHLINCMAPGYIVEPYIFKMPPNYYMSWHKDAVRTVGINIPIDDLKDSVTIFTEDSDITDDAGLISKKCMHINKIPYQLGGMYLLDVTRYHCVFNLSNQNRFIIIAIWNSGQDRYSDVFNHLKSHKLV